MREKHIILKHDSNGLLENYWRKCTTFDNFNVFFITKITMKIDDGMGRIKVQPFWQLQSLNLIIPKVTASRQKIELVTRLSQILLRSGVLSQ